MEIIDVTAMIFAGLYHVSCIFTSRDIAGLKKCFFEWIQISGLQISSSQCDHNEKLKSRWNELTQNMFRIHLPVGAYEMKNSD